MRGLTNSGKKWLSRERDTTCKDTRLRHYPGTALNVSMVPDPPQTPSSRASPVRVKGPKGIASISRFRVLNSVFDPQIRFLTAESCKGGPGCIAVRRNRSFDLFQNHESDASYEGDVIAQL